MTVNESACVYASLILQDEGLEITSDKIATLIKAANVEVDSIWPSIFAKALAGKDLEAMLFSIGTSAPASSSAAPGASAAASGAGAKEEVKEEAKEEESDDDMGFGLFD
jgi:large subunit ribosomal protein LP1